MPESRKQKETAWKKNRKFGDVKGGRMRPKLADNIFNRAHNFLSPTAEEETPIYMVDNPARNFYFPVTVNEIKEFLNQLPEEHTKNLTHIWLRKPSKNNTTQGSFICGNGVNLVVLYPFPKNLVMMFGQKKPDSSTLKWYASYKPKLVKEGKDWVLIWTEEGVKKYYLEGLLLHELGHQLDSYYKRYWSPTYKNKAENFANNYAYYWSNELRMAYD